MAHTIAEIATALEAEAFGAVSMQVVGLAEPSEAGPEELALAMDEKYADGLAEGQAKAAVLWPGADWQALGLEAAIIISRPRYAMSGLTQYFAVDQRPEPGIHPSAVIDRSAVIGEGVSIGPLCVIGANVTIGADAVIADHVSIASGCQIGARAMIRAGVRIGDDVQIGDDFFCQPGAVIGGDGFSFVTPEKSRAEEVRETFGEESGASHQTWERIYSLGAVEIGNNVEIGANSTVDRGTIRATRIGDGTKIDSQVQVGHNVVVGRDCLLCAQVGVAGSSTIGDRVVLAGQSGVADNIFVGDDVVIGAAAKVLSSVPAGRAMLGYPAVKMKNQIETYKALRRLPRLMDDVKALQKAVSKLKEND